VPACFSHIMVCIFWIAADEKTPNASIHGSKSIIFISNLLQSPSWISWSLRSVCLNDDSGSVCTVCNLFPFPLPHLQYLQDFDIFMAGATCVAGTIYSCAKCHGRWGPFSFQCLTGVDCKYEQHGVCLIRSGNCWPFESIWVHPRFVDGVRGANLFLFCLSLSCVVCVQCCQCLWIIHCSLPFRFSLTSIYTCWLLFIVDVIIVGVYFFINYQFISSRLGTFLILYLMCSGYNVIDVRLCNLLCRCNVICLLLDRTLSLIFIVLVEIWKTKNITL